MEAFRKLFNLKGPDRTNMPRRHMSAKCVLVGDMFVGKTSLAQVFVNGFFVENYAVSCGGTFMAKTLQNPPITLQLWDTAGMERFRSMLPHFMRDAACVILVYDTTERATFLSIRDFWMDFVRESTVRDDITLVMVGNKCDLSCKRNVKEIEAKALADHYGMLYIETSAKTRENIQNLFLKAANRIYESGILKTEDGREGGEVVSISPDLKKKINKCCSSS